MCWAYK
jgi:hypothetical protein